MSRRIRVAAGSIRDPSDDILTFASQLGCSGIILNTPNLSGRPPFGSSRIGSTYWKKPGDDVAPAHWDYLELLQLRTRIESYGLRLEGIENTPLHFYQKCILGLPGRDQEIENYQETIRNLGRSGIPILGYHWMANSVWRTSKSEPARGGARTSVYDHELGRNAPLSFDREYSEEELWANYGYFIQAVLPIAQEAGVTLALHPDDPPVDSLGGVARIFRNLKGFRRALEAIAPEPNHKLDFCMGTWAEMGVDEMFAGLRYFGERGRIAYVHFRNVRGAVPCITETFIDEGDVDVVEVMKLLVEMGFDGFIIDDHVPEMDGDTLWSHRGRAYATGYIKGLLRAVESLTT
jgi:mannonate dehydratase